MDRNAIPPFMLQLFYRTGAFHRPDEFTTSPMPPHLSLHTWSDCNLNELTHYIAAEGANILPSPAIGTRLAFRLMFPDTRGNISTARYMVKELGSVVIGNGGAGLDPDAVDGAGEVKLETEGAKTLTEARFVVGDYISCAILPPLPDGSVAPASSARMGRGTGAGELRAAVGQPPIGGGARERETEGENGYATRSGRVKNSGRGAGYDSFGGRNGGNVPMGEWRRGEKVPDMPPPSQARRRDRY